MKRGDRFDPGSTRLKRRTKGCQKKVKAKGREGMWLRSAKLAARRYASDREADTDGREEGGRYLMCRTARFDPVSSGGTQRHKRRARRRRASSRREQSTHGDTYTGCNPLTAYQQAGVKLLVCSSQSGAALSPPATEERCHGGEMKVHQIRGKQSALQDRRSNDR